MLSEKLLHVIIMSSRAVTSTTLQEARDAKQGKHLDITEPDDTLTLVAHADNSRREVLEWLSPIAPDRKQDEILQQHYPGTGRWVLSTTGFTDWITKEHGILWCYGSRMSPLPLCTTNA